MSRSPSFPVDGRARIFPAIDLRGGRCVRLVKGRREAEIDYAGDPVAVARRWESEGAECLHVIDLGAALGEPDSSSVVLEVASAVSIPVQSGGGVRDEERAARLLDGGVARVILGTRAFRDPEFLRHLVAERGAERVVVGLDCEGERVRVAGWEEASELDVGAGLDLVRAAGVRHLLVTAIDRDGTLSGPRRELVERVLAAGGLRVVAAGGIGELAHVASLLDLAHPDLEGVVVGRALWEGTVELREALALARRAAGRDGPSADGPRGKAREETARTLKDTEERDA